MNVCQIIVAHFAHVECMFDKINNIFQGFGSLVSLRLQKDGRAKSKQIWMNLSHWNTDNLSSHCEDLLIFSSLCKHSACKTAVIYYYITTEFHYSKRDSAYLGVMHVHGGNVNRHFSQILILLIFF